jgi:zinc transporter ZupT
MYLFNLLLFVITLIGGLLPLRNKDFHPEKINTILAFSGSFLLAVTLLHLIPETFTDIGSKAGLFHTIGYSTLYTWSGAWSYSRTSSW